MLYVFPFCLYYYLFFVYEIQYTEDLSSAALRRSDDDQPIPIMSISLAYDPGFFISMFLLREGFL